MKWIACVIRAAAGFNARTFGALNQERRVSMGICKRRPRRPAQGGISLPKQFRDLGGGLVAEEGNWVAGISYKIVLGRARLSEAAEKTPILGGAAPFGCAQGRLFSAATRPCLIRASAPAVCDPGSYQGMASAVPLPVN